MIGISTRKLSSSTENKVTTQSPQTKYMTKTGTGAAPSRQDAVRSVVNDTIPIMALLNNVNATATLKNGHPICVNIGNRQDNPNNGRNTTVKRFGCMSLS